MYFFLVILYGGWIQMSEKRITASERHAVFSIHYHENKNFISPEISFLNLIIHI